MVQLSQSGLRLGSYDLVSALRPTIYRPSRPTPRVTPDRDGDAPRPTAPRIPTPERGKTVVKPS